MKIKVNRIPFYIAIILIVFLMYIYMQNALEFKAISTKNLQLVIMTLCLLCVCPHMSRVPLFLFYGVIFGIAMYFAVFINATTDIDLVYCFSKAFFWVLVMWMSYAATRYYEMGKVYLAISVCALLLLCCVYVASLQTDYSISNKDYTITSVYYIFCFFPFVLHIKQSRWQNCLIVLICALVFVSFKRSAILTLACVMVLLIGMNRKKFQTRTVVATIAGAAILATLILMLCGTRTVSNTGNLRDIVGIWIRRFGAGDASRQTIYSEVLARQFKSGVLQWIIGHGYNAVQTTTSLNLSAHNDFLEILYDYGIIAFGIYLIFIWLLIRKCMAMKKSNSESYQGMAISILIFILVSIPSHMLTYSTYFIIIAVYWGFAIGLDDRNMIRKEQGDPYENRNFNIPQSL